MSTFIQMHLLTSYPPANLNRDDLGQPKTAVVGGTKRLRISSQSLKRAWRTSDLMEQALNGHKGIRTKEMGVKIFEALTTGKTLEQVLTSETRQAELPDPAQNKKQMEMAKTIAGIFGKNKKTDKEKPLNELAIEQLAHFSPEEIKALSELTEEVRDTDELPEARELDLLRKNHKAADIAMFGRMLAADPAYNTEAAVQVAHAISVNKIAVEDDFFTAVDDLNTGAEDVGAGHMGVTEFGQGLFYLYVCINRDLLVENLQGDENLAGRALRALGEAAVKVGPTGKQNSFASRAYADFALVERGTQQPRSLSVAFLTPVSPNGQGGMLGSAIQALETTRNNINQVYGPCADDQYSFNTLTGEGKLDEFLNFISE